MASAGADVALVGRDRAALEETQRACRDAHPSGKGRDHLVADVTDEAAAPSLRQRCRPTLELFGRLDFVVANVSGQSIDGD